MTPSTTPTRIALAAALALAMSAGTYANAEDETVGEHAETIGEKVDAALGDLKLTGYLESSYAWSSANAPGHNIVGRSFDRFDNEFAFNAFQIVLSKPVASDKWDAGFTGKLLFGQNAKLIQSAGLNLGDQGDLEEGYVTLNIPIGNGLTLKGGKMVTLMGVEVIEDPVNPVWSEGNQFLFVENFTNTGAEISYKWNDYVDTQFRVFNGWDVVEDNNNTLSYMARIGITPCPGTVLSIIPFGGPEQAHNDNDWRKGVDVVLSQFIGDKTSLFFQGDYGKEDANSALPDPNKDAEWWAIGGWAKYNFTENYGVAFRADYFDDMDGARTSGSPFTAPYPANTGNKIWTLTLAGNLGVWKNVLVRPEIRYDDSSLANAYGPGDDKQVSLGLSVAYVVQ